jgi:hypothetical protein
MAHFHSNLSVYRSIADEANAQAQLLWDQARTPKPDGSAGFTIALDPSRKAFKQSMIAIAFSAIYFEALLYLVGTKKMGAKWNDEWDRKKTLEQKLRELGVNDEDFLNSAERLRKSRKDLVHEKAVLYESPPGVMGENLANTELRFAQEEAAFATAFISQVTTRLQSTS